LATAGADSRVAELLGREDELAQLYDLIGGIDRCGGALVVRGETGIGKSALFAAAKERALHRGITVVSRTGSLSEAQLAFAGLHQLLLPVLGGLDFLPDPQRRALEAAFGIAEGDAPDLFLIGLATLGLVGERAEGQEALFTDDTRFVVYMDGEGSEPTYVLHGREALTPVFEDLERYEATTHLNGQSTVTLDGNRATGESYTIAHHVFTENGRRKIMIASLRYLDTFTKIDQSWYFAERKLILDWSETRSLGTDGES
jgi:hypothetical protein